MANPNTPKEDEATAKLAQISKDTWNIVSNIEDFDRLQLCVAPLCKSYASRELSIQVSIIQTRIVFDAWSPMTMS